MSAPNNNHDDNSLVDAYNQMMARVKDSTESVGSSAINLQRALDLAKKH